MYKTLTEKNVAVTVKNTQPGAWSGVLFYVIVPLLLIGGMWFFMIRQMQTRRKQGAVVSARAARACSPCSRRRSRSRTSPAWTRPRKSCRRSSSSCAKPQKFQKLGGRIPKGVLLIGPPGTGKTLLARAVAGEANVPFFSISGSDFVEMFVGVGASRVRDLFEQGKKNAPCIIFIDEIDAVGRHRGAGLGGGHDEREQTLNQLLVEMDGFESNEGVILVAATNRPDVLDPALLRPGRFDRRVVVGRPDVRGREEILRVHTRKIPLADDVDLSVMARGTPGFSGADLANMVNEAALNAARYNRKAVMMCDFELAKDKVLMGAERKSHAADRRGEAQHGVPRGRPRAGRGDAAACRSAAQGHDHPARHGAGRDDAACPTTTSTPTPRTTCETQLAILMGGRIAEEIFLNHMTTGAGNDIERATELARKMVCEWGMSDLGPLTFGKKEEQIFLGREIAQHRDFSEETAMQIDEQVKKFVDGAATSAAQQDPRREPRGAGPHGARHCWSARRWTARRSNCPPARTCAASRPW